MTAAGFVKPLQKHVLFRLEIDNFRFHRLTGEAFHILEERMEVTVFPDIHHNGGFFHLAFLRVEQRNQIHNQFHRQMVNGVIPKILHNPQHLGFSRPGHSGNDLQFKHSRPSFNRTLFSYIHLITGKRKRKAKAVLMKFQQPLVPHTAKLPGHGRPIHAEIIRQLLTV